MFASSRLKNMRKKKQQINNALCVRKVPILDSKKKTKNEKKRKTEKFTPSQKNKLDDFCRNRAHALVSTMRKCLLHFRLF